MGSRLSCSQGSKLILELLDGTLLGGSNLKLIVIICSNSCMFIIHLVTFTPPPSFVPATISCWSTFMSQMCFFKKVIRINMQEKACIYLCEYILLHLTWWSPLPFTFPKIMYLGLQVLGPGQAPKATLINPVSKTYIYYLFLPCGQIKFHYVCIPHFLSLFNC